MPYNDLHSSDVFTNPPELKPFESLPQPVARRVTSIDAAVSYITRLSTNYQDEKSTESIVTESLSATSQNVLDVSSARNTLEGVYEGV